MKTLLLLAILTVSLGHVSCRCNKDDIAKCSKDAEAVLDVKPYICQETKRSAIAKLVDCMNCGGASQFQEISSKIDALDKKNCKRERAFTDCSTIEQFTCAFNFFATIPTIAAFQLQDVAKLCTDIASVQATFVMCSRCILTLIPESNDFKESVLNVINMTRTMIDGGCNCSRDIYSQVQVLSTPGISDCVFVSAVLNITKAIIVDCTLKLVAVPIHIPWAAVVNNYIATVLPLTGTLCNAFIPTPLVVNPNPPSGGGPLVVAGGAGTSKLSGMAFVASAAAVPWTMASICGRGHN